MPRPSALILVKNEEYWLPYVLKQTEGFFDSYVIYDVGSTDKTRDIIDWFTKRMNGKADLMVKYLPHVPPEVQGTFRNSMIVEGKKPVYFILDGDELYRPEDLAKLTTAAEELEDVNRVNSRMKYGVVRRVEVNPDLTQQYAERRGHHRLYTKDAFWTGTHPGEVAYYRQSEKSEIQFDDITCWHMHNTLRSPNEEDALSRISRKRKKAYHPGGHMKPMDLLEELPILRTPIEDFKVSPALAALQTSSQI
jgi:glycosyltransferase involved in cell wall biosynthesis